MDLNHQSMTSLQEFLKSLDLQPLRGDEDDGSGKILIGKLLASRVFRMFTIAEIAQKTWRLKAKIRKDKIEDNIFKFTFGSKEEKDQIFRGRPWSLNGAHLILKEWPGNLSLKEISFGTTIFTIQVHGLPPVFIHEGTGARIGNMIGTVHNDSINRRCRVANSYLRFRMDISTEKPIPTGFFQDRAHGEELLIQFKYKRMADFCYICGVLSHVTGKCAFGKPATITTANGITAKVYGPWLRAEHDGDMLFVNISNNEKDRKENTRERKAWERHNLQKSLTYHIENRETVEGLKAPCIAEKALIIAKDRTNADINLALAVSLEMDTLDRTIRRQLSGDLEEIQTAMLNQVRLSNYDPQALATWATGLVKQIGCYNANIRASADGVSSSILGEFGLGPAYRSAPSGSKPIHVQGRSLLSTKPAAPIQLLDSSNKSSPMEKEQVSLSFSSPGHSGKTNVRKFEPETLTPQHFSLGQWSDDENQKSQGSRFRRWKRDARDPREGGQTSRGVQFEDQSSSSRTEEATTRDFRMAEEAG